MLQIPLVGLIPWLLHSWPLSPSSIPEPTPPVPPFTAYLPQQWADWGREERRGRAFWTSRSYLYLKFWYSLHHDFFFCLNFLAFQKMSLKYDLSWLLMLLLNFMSAGSISSTSPRTQAWAWEQPICLVWSPGAESEPGSGRCSMASLPAWRVSSLHGFVSVVIKSSGNGHSFLWSLLWQPDINIGSPLGLYLALRPTISIIN